MRAWLLVLAACGRVDFAATPDAATHDAATPDAAHGPMLAQQVTSMDLGPATSLSATLPALPQSGSLLVMIGAIQSDMIMSTTGAGATWTLAQLQDTNANCELWYGITDGSDATVTIAGALPSQLWISLQEWRGAGAFDGTNGTSGVTSPASAGVLTLTSDDLVIFAVSDDLPNTFGTPTGAMWTALDAPTIPGAYIEQPWFTIAATGTLAPQVTETNGHWDAVIAAFRVTSP